MASQKRILFERESTLWQDLDDSLTQVPLVSEKSFHPLQPRLATLKEDASLPDDEAHHVHAQPQPEPGPAVSLSATAAAIEPSYAPQHDDRTAAAGEGEYEEDASASASSLVIVERLSSRLRGLVPADSEPSVIAPRDHDDSVVEGGEDERPSRRERVLALFGVSVGEGSIAELPLLQETVNKQAQAVQQEGEGRGLLCRCGSMTTESTAASTAPATSALALIDEVTSQVRQARQDAIEESLANEDFLRHILERLEKFRPAAHDQLDTSLPAPLDATPTPPLTHAAKTPLDEREKSFHSRMSRLLDNTEVEDALEALDAEGSLADEEAGGGEGGEGARDRETLSAGDVVGRLQRGGDEDMREVLQWAIDVDERLREARLKHQGLVNHLSEIRRNQQDQEAIFEAMKTHTDALVDRKDGLEEEIQDLLSATMLSEAEITSRFDQLLKDHEAARESHRGLRKELRETCSAYRQRVNDLRRTNTTLRDELIGLLRRDVNLQDAFRAYSKRAAALITAREHRPGGTVPLVQQLALD
ncbi:unnamed protein product [Vitrella brassicaformis CCMP3155]|uniref:Uncharacterized protein n=1 Tax=Vitrella brassicaformis (strain CCMP3155) TaxID=1169540 RepID=A0A0G4EJ78_VITBC|nr:unnamed protein product [Vitrella brassicaformis CCMP3155]|eukprot:CEL96443.1 unnamed protein product [Vitrella brassicaformis CCMP3155]